MLTFNLPNKKEGLHLLGQFFIGGVVVSGISAVSVLLNTKDAALLYALPVTYVPVLVYVWKHNGNTKTETKCGLNTLVTYVGQNVAGFTLITIFCMSLYFIISAHSKTNPKNKDDKNTLTRAWMSAVSLVLFAMFGVLYWMWVCNVAKNGSCAPEPRYCVLGSTA